VGCSLISLTHTHTHTHTRVQRDNYIKLDKYDQAKNSEMGGACSTQGRYKKRDEILVGKLEEKDYVQDLAVDGLIADGNTLMNSRDP
jgi:hypothetical protein